MQHCNLFLSLYVLCVACNMNSPQYYANLACIEVAKLSYPINEWCFSLGIVVLTSVYFIHCFLYSGLWKYIAEGRNAWKLHMYMYSKSTQKHLNHSIMAKLIKMVKLSFAKSKIFCYAWHFAMFCHGKINCTDLFSTR